MFFLLPDSLTSWSWQTEAGSVCFVFSLIGRPPSQTAPRSVTEDRASSPSATHPFCRSVARLLPWKKSGAPRGARRH